MRNGFCVAADSVEADDVSSDATSRLAVISRLPRRPRATCSSSTVNSIAYAPIGLDMIAALIPWGAQ